MDRDYGARFTINELVDATSTPARTIRYYIEKGLLSPALGRGRSSYYTSVHVEELAKIRELRERNLSLDEIRDALSEESAPQEQPLGETWTRVALLPDMELYVRDGAPEYVEALARQIVQLVEHAFETEPEW